MPNISQIRKIDQVLAFSLILAFIFCLHGINWGRVEEWHPDQMAFVKLFYDGELPLNPKWFHKPPFHTYFNFFLSILPLKILGKFLHLSSSFVSQVILIWCRILTAFLFLGSIAIAFIITKSFFGIFPARIIAILFATSAGFIAFSHFLTVDIPVMFWMLLAFYFSKNILERGKFLDYVLAGFFTGIATSTKYNGLAVGITIVVAHLLSIGVNSWSKIFFSKKLWWGLIMVVVGFLTGNPFALLDYSTFIADFMFNYIVTPVYDDNTGHSYWIFFARFTEIIGWPGLAILGVAFVVIFYLAFTSKLTQINSKFLILIMSILMFYYYKFASFPRLPARFVLPIVPFCLIASGLFWQKVKLNRIIVAAILVPLISYNLICSLYVGKRFIEDPRMASQIWVKENIPNNSSMETTRYAPQWNKIPGVKIKDTRMPDIGVRKKFFIEKFKYNSWIINHKLLTTQQKPQWYSEKELMERQPDYIAVNYRYYSRFFDSLGEKYYPDIKQYFRELLAEKYTYRIIFDRESLEIPVWIYPQKIDSLENRMTILSKKKNY